jgi:hypothetical protein
MEKITEIFGIVEVRNNGGAANAAYEDAINALRHTSINGHKVLAVWSTTNEKPTQVPHFGWNHRCAENCSHTVLDNGVSRYFGINCVVENDFPPEHFGTYKLTPNSRFTVTGRLVEPVSPPQGYYKEAIKCEEATKCGEYD